MKAWDGRHKWGPVVQDGARIRRTCSACGRTDTYETLIPNAVMNEIVAGLARTANPYRAIAEGFR